MRKSTKMVISLIALGLIFTACSNMYVVSEHNLDTHIKATDTMIMTVPVVIDLNYCCTGDPEVEIEERSYSDEEVIAIATTLAGECYDDKLDDKRSVAEVICNRVSDGGFGESIKEVVSAKGQFAGYWNQSRLISGSDIQIAKDTLNDWYSNNCEQFSEYLFFCAGPNRENIFRTAF